jgi:phenylalanyl-tRNA synthetase beta chain
MRAPVTWLREVADLPESVTGRQMAEHLIRAGLEVEAVEQIGVGLRGDVVIGRVVGIDELTEFRKPIRWCQVDIGEAQPRGIICGAQNFVVGDLVVVALPGTVLPGDFTITARKTYGHTSDGMICSERELGISAEHAGILVLPADAGLPGTVANSMLGVGEEILDIAVTPDRGYALSIRGLARELAIAYGRTFADPALADPHLPAPSQEQAPHASGSDDLTACPLFTLRTIIGFDPTAATPEWMRSRLQACGMRPISLAVDVTNYVMLELGQPLHAFDLDKVHGPIRAARAVQGQTFTTLDHVERVLTAEDLVITDDQGPLGLAGVMGGLDSEIDERTTNIALEAAYFEPRVVARAARRHRLSTEASRRFERGVDRMLAPFASARAAALLIQFGGGQHCGLTAVEAPAPRITIEFDLDEPARVAGMPIEQRQVTTILDSIGCELGDAERVHRQVHPPTWRPDLRDPADLVEEVLRLIGYDAIPATLPVAPAGRGLTLSQRLRRRIGFALAGAGLVEVLTYPFMGDEDADALGLAPDDLTRPTARLANPISENEPYLRSVMLAGLAAAARRNLARGTTDLAIYEMGSVFRGKGSGARMSLGVDGPPTSSDWAALQATLPQQHQQVAGLLMGSARNAGWWGSARHYDWGDAVACAQAIAAALGLNLQVRAGTDPAFHPGRCAALSIQPTGQHMSDTEPGDADDAAVTIGVAGELHPRTCERLGLPARTCAFDMNVTALLAASTEIRPAPRISSHPVAKEDLALVVAKQVAAADVAASLARGAGEVLESVRLFDVYTGPQVPDGHRSLAFALRLRAADRTLSADEITAARQGALAAVERDFGARLR